MRSRSREVVISVDDEDVYDNLVLGFSYFHSRRSLWAVEFFDARIRNRQFAVEIVFHGVGSVVVREFSHADRSWRVYFLCAPPRRSPAK